ncbi:MKI67 FHA domain-interacting nucleolar phosphoprotein [Odontomachus brunneus]|uniref:MKI67 FHA domain-interacting nucleolar phosphoprotein n=1 Tax=Odontomachus brunneus TaxID=486640 RepID=UPI0013F28EE2|nr:MKI67 FHA domain-interacting nucleolar phosphoprotein [Odontomachus brunneus]
MKVTKKDMVSKEPVLRKIAKNKRKVLKPKAGVSLEKAVKNVQQILKKKNTEIKKKSKKDIEIKSKKKSNLTKYTLTKSKPTSISKTSPKSVPHKEKRSKDKGIVYVGHIPHGFYEEQMEDYFKQFGKITQVRVARSKRTGKSRGYGYVEFMFKDVAKIAAETMNNYLMCGRLLKATYIPPEKQHSGFFSGANWSEKKYPKLRNRQRAISQKNSTQNAEDHQNYVKSSLSKLSTLENKLQMKGISIKFEPVDMPQF